MTPPFSLVVMGGEGIGPEVTAEGVRVFTACMARFGIEARIEHFEVGEAAFARTGRWLPADAEAACDAARPHGAILFGAVADEPIGILRKQYDLFANLRPIRALPVLAASSPLRPERIAGTDLLIVRELVSDVYYGERRQGVGANGRWAVQEMYYDERDARRSVRVGFEQARARRKHLVFVHKANVIPEVFALFHDELRRQAPEFPDVRHEAILVDNMAMQLVLGPSRYDVLLCPNLFGDILSDLGAGLLGSLGLLPSASLDENGFGLYEPVGGTAPDIAGRGIANPASSILSVAMLLRHGLHREDAALAVERAIERVLAEHRTADLWVEGTRRVGTRELGELVAERVRGS